MSKDILVPKNGFSTYKKPPMEKMNPNWDYAPYDIYRDLGYSDDQIINRDIPTWPELKKEKGIVIRSKKVD